jgi:hypothetical protein
MEAIVYAFYSMVNVYWLWLLPATFFITVAVNASGEYRSRRSRL